MPSVSKKQAGLMAGCAHNPAKMRVKCPTKSVAKEFVAADAAKAKPAPKKKR